jgi:hypothetical protein
MDMFWPYLEGPDETLTLLDIASLLSCVREQSNTSQEGE